jgi:ubiquinone/menaquinone biosynthesis C-methylase UbiE
VKEWVASLRPGLFLDAGSGTGMYRPVLEGAGHRSVSLDLSIEMLRNQSKAQTALKQNAPLPLVQGDIKTLPFKDSCFDYLLCTRVLSHIKRLDLALSELARVVKPHAELIISDVHPAHRYTVMSVPRNNGKKISIKIFKHRIADLKRAFAAVSFRLLRLEQYGLKDLTWRPPRQHFEKVYDEPEQSIFYVCWLMKA